MELTHKVKEQNSGNKKCSRCGNHFVCNSHDIQECHCAKVTINDSHKQYLQNQYLDCLCEVCLNIILKTNEKEMK